MVVFQYSWVDFRKTKAGIKLNMKIKFHDVSNKVLPDKVVIVPARTADRTQRYDLFVTSDNAINIFKRGYVDYEKFMITQIIIFYFCPG